MEGNTDCEVLPKSPLIIREAEKVSKLIRIEPEQLVCVTGTYCFALSPCTSLQVKYVHVQVKLRRTSLLGSE